LVNEKIMKLISLFKEEYPMVRCELLYEKDYELLFATRLSAQCTDKRVNMITKDLFKKYPTLASFRDADLPELETMVHSCGVFKTKAKNIKDAAGQLLERFGGRVPDTMEELLTLPGVGRKTANLILGDIYGKPAIIADTHCIRLSNRLGLCKTKDPLKVETTLKKILPPEEQRDFCHRLVRHGRLVCIARRPLCENCRVRELCSYFMSGAGKEMGKGKKRGTGK